MTTYEGKNGTSQDPSPHDHLCRQRDPVSYPPSMRYLLFLLLIAVTFSRAYAEELRLANGRTLTNIAITRIDSDGVLITPQTFAASAVKYKWPQINSEDAARLMLVGQEQAQRERALERLQSSMIILYGEIWAFENEGIKAYAVPVEKVPMADGSTNYRPVNGEKKSVVFIECKPSKDAVDDDKFVTEVYPIGVIERYGSRIRAYTTDPDKALAAMSAQQAER